MFVLEKEKKSEKIKEKYRQHSRGINEEFKKDRFKDSLSHGTHYVCPGEGKEFRENNKRKIQAT